MPQVFISYSRVDTTFVEHLIRRVQLAFPDVKIWQDTAPHGLIGGDNWWEAILKAVAESDVFIYVLSNESVQSAYCQAEFTEARRLQKRIVTIQARDKTELTDELDDIQFVDMKHGVDDPEALQRLNAALNKQLAQAKKQRPLWKPATPKPSKEPPPTRTAASPDITTPVLIRPPAEDEALKIARSGLRWQIASVVIAVIFGLIALIPLLNGGGASNPTSQPTTAVALQSTDSSAVPSDIPTLNPPPTLEIALVVGTLDAEATIAQGTLNANNTAAAHATDYARGTQSALDQTATATLWTSTPTPNITASIEAFRTQRAATETQAFVAGQTATAASWTDTPTPNPTLTFTPTPTFTPTVTPLPPGFAPITRNTDWISITQDFDGVNMVLVPAGCFDMGSEDGQDDEKPVNRQCFDVPFWLDQTEVTQADFERLNGQKANPNAFDGDQRPVENITWFEARDFCALRGMRLPTEREWEYAARGPDNLIYPWGNDWNPENVVWSGNSERQQVSVGSRPAGASWAGALDMSGNVWEWVSSLYLPYNTQEEREVDTGSRTDVLRGLRGNSWNGVSVILRAPLRSWTTPDLRANDVGFRCARSS
jgi:formylglycine-generating enzyme